MKGESERKRESSRWTEGEGRSGRGVLMKGIKRRPQSTSRTDLLVSA